MISIRSCVMAVTGLILAAAADAAPATKGFGIPGEILFTTPSFEATWQNYRGRLALFSLVDKRTDEPLLISQDSFTIIFADEQFLRSSEMESGSVAIEQFKARADAPSVEERMGGKRATVSLTDSSTGVSAKWSVFLPEGADYLVQSIRLSAARETKIGKLDIVNVQLEGAKAETAPGAAAIVTDTLFMGVKHPKAAGTITGAKVHCAVTDAITVGPGTHFEVSSLIGAAEKGKAAEAFKNALKAEPVPPKAAKEEPKKKAAKEAAKPAAAKQAEKTPEKKAEKKAEKQAEKTAEKKIEKAETVRLSVPAPKKEAKKAAAQPEVNAAAPAKKDQPAPKPLYKFPENINVNAPVPAG